VAINSSWTILTTIWPGVTDLTTVAPIACSRTFSVKLLTTSSETSASSSARRTSPHRGIDVGFRQRAAPRQPIENATQFFRQIVEQFRFPSSCRTYPGHPRMRLVPAGNRRDEFPNNFAPEGASRCRALTFRLKGRAAGRKERLFEKWRDLQRNQGEVKKSPISRSGQFLPNHSNIQDSFSG